MQLQQIRLYRLRLPLSMPVRHNLAVHHTVESLIVQAVTTDGVEGFGEGIPRFFVTGETMESSVAALEKELLPRLSAKSAAGPEELIELCTDLGKTAAARRAPAALCALETALMDAAGKSWNLPVAQILGGSGKNNEVVYSAVVPMLEEAAVTALLAEIRGLEMRQVKLKVGRREDERILAISRDLLGPEVQIRVDANGAWSPREAIARIEAMKAYGVEAVEQPVGADDFDGLALVAHQAGVPIIADESLRTPEDALRLGERGGCHLFNLRLSKCGGLVACRRLLEIGKQRGIKAQLGCQVGETGVLSAAGRHFAVSTDGLVYVEGSYSNYLLAEDIVVEPVAFGVGGRAALWDKPGLGVTVDTARLHRHSQAGKEIPLAKM